MSNPLLESHKLPPFTEITPNDVVPAIKELIENCRESTHQLLENLGEVSWETLEKPIEEFDDKLSQAWSPVSHLNSVMNSDELRAAYNACLPLLSEYATEMGQNEDLFKAVKQLKDSDAFGQLSDTQKRVIENQLKDFHLSGIDLPAEKKKRYGEIQKRLSELSSKFGENVLDATQAWQKHIADVSELTGLPESALQSAASAAKAKDLEGYLFTLDIPSYLALITYAENRELRHEIYEAYVTRASDQGPNAGEFDNSANMDELLKLRYELAQLLGFEQYADLSLAKKMAETPKQVLDFLYDLAHKARAQAIADRTELENFAKEELGIDDLQVWDVAFASEKLKHAKYEISQEQLRPYFPAPKVISGMFSVVEKLFGIRFIQNDSVTAWHPDVTYYELVDEQDQPLAAFYLDLYARDKKRGGAWMDECRIRRRNNTGELQLPVAYLTCNFTPPLEDRPSLLTHDEVTTLFHEFGHGLHHMLTQVEEAAVSGINGVAWDAVELPSQFMENWCWEKDALQLISGHFETGEVLPDELLQKMLAAKNFQSAMMMMRQLEFSIFDMRIHMEYDPEKGIDSQAILSDVRKEVAVFTAPEFNRFQHSFSHIFAGGYAAGYYSYKWAEVLSADAFSKFEEEGIFNTETGHLFKSAILEKGGSKEPMELFKAFRGREPSVDPLLRHSGIQI